MDLGEQSYRAASSMADRDFTESALVGINRQNPTGLLQYITNFKRRSNSRMVIGIAVRDDAVNRCIAIGWRTSRSLEQPYNRVSE
jgi:hypothetical protein